MNMKVIAAAAMLFVAGKSYANYLAVEWIKAGGAQWIDTLYTPACSDRVEVKVRFASIESTQAICCSRGTKTSESTFTMMLFKASSSSRYLCTHRNTTTTMTLDPTPFCPVVGEDCVIVADGSTLDMSVNGESIGTMAGGIFEPGSPFSLFATHTAGTRLSATTAMANFGSFTMYYFMVYDADGRIVRWFVPAMDDSVGSGVARYGVYDLCTGAFCPGIGSGSFTAGRVVGTLERFSSDRKPSIVDTGVSGEDIVLTGGVVPGMAHHVYVGYGEEDAGPATNGWDCLAKCADIPEDASTFSVEYPRTFRCARVFLTPAIAGAKVVESVASSGVDEYVDTGFKPDHNSKAVYHFKMLRDDFAYAVPFGSRKENARQFFVGAAGSGGTWSRDDWYHRFGYKNDDNNTGYRGKPSVAGEHTFVLDKTVYTLDKWTYPQAANTWDASYNAYVFACNDTDVASTFAPMEFYSLDCYDNGELVRSYLPVVTDEGEAALYDAVNRVFAENKGTTALVAGDEKFLGSELFDSSEVKEATWKGRGDRNDLSDPKNWACTNALGYEVVGGVPDARNSTVFVPAGEGFQFPAGSVAIWKALEIGDGALSDDSDWSGLGTMPNLTGVIDLHGHALHLKGLSGDGEVTDSVGAGELHVNVDEDRIGNWTVKLTGQLRFFKEGDGDFVFGKEGQSYAGGTEVVAGKILTDIKAGKLQFGGEARVGSAKITVNEGAALDLNGQMGWGYCTVILNGGTICGTSEQPNLALVLRKDSEIRTFGDWGSSSYGGIASCDLGGSVLTVDIAVGKHLYVSAPATNGVINIVNGGWLHTCKNAIDMRSVSLMNGAAALKLETALNVKDYHAGYAQDYNYGTVPMNVYGTFTPAAEFFYGCTLQDGAILDLSGVTGPWSTTSLFSGGLNTVGFADGAKISIEFGNRTVGEGERVVEWAVKPSNIGSFKFVSTDPRYGFKVLDDGVYRYEKGGLLLMVR